MKRTEPMQIGKVIEQMIDATGLRPELNRRSIEAAWPVVVGQHIAAYTSSVRLDGRVLKVQIKSAALKEELMYLRPLLIQQLNDLTATNQIDDIKII